MALRACNPVDNRAYIQAGVQAGVQADNLDDAFDDRNSAHRGLQELPGWAAQR